MTHFLPINQLLPPLYSVLVDTIFLDVPVSEGGNTAPPDEHKWQNVQLFGEHKMGGKKLETLLQLAGYTREIFGAQPGRRFVLGFSLREALMRLIMFDRSGGVASDEFNVHENGRRFVRAIVAFQMMHDQQMGLDPTIRVDSEGRKLVSVVRDSVHEDIVLDKVLATTKAISSRGTTVWKGYRLNDTSGNAIVVKDTWQLLERPDEGELLRRVKEGAQHLVTYYHHEVVQVNCCRDGADLIRKGLAEGRGKIAKLHVRQENRGFDPVSYSAEGSLGSRMVSPSGASAKRGASGSKRLKKDDMGLWSTGNIRVHRRLYMTGVG